jgi:hypothetical protein
MKVKNMESAKGNSIPNQFVISDNGNEYFQSYQFIIVKRDNNSKITLDRKYWDYSSTTSKYRNLFLGETKKETLQKIKSGEYLLDNLNP